MSKLTVIVFAAAIFAQDAKQIVEESQRRHRSTTQQYEGVLQVFNPNGRNSEKRWQFFRSGNYGESRALLRFVSPPEVKGVALLIVNHADRASDQWMWLPELQRGGWTTKYQGRTGGWRCRTGRRGFSARISVMRTWKSAT